MGGGILIVAIQIPVYSSRNEIEALVKYIFWLIKRKLCVHSQIVTV